MAGTYPFDNLEVGDKIIVAGRTGHAINSAIRAWSKKNPGKVLRSRKVGDRMYEVTRYPSSPKPGEKIFYHLVDHDGAVIFGPTSSEGIHLVRPLAQRFAGRKLDIVVASYSLGDGILNDVLDPGGSRK